MTRSSPPSRPSSAQVTGERRGPGGHILTGPVYVEGAEPGDVLEVKILVDRAGDRLRLQRLQGVLPENCEPGPPVQNHPPRPQADDGRVCSRHRHSASPVLRQHGRRAGTRGRPRQQQSAGASRRQPRQSRAGRRAARSISRSLPAARCSRSATDTSRRATARSIRPPSRLPCAARVQLTVRKDMKLTWPRAETPTDYICMATDPDLTVATGTPSRRWWISWSTEKHLTRHQAYQLVSIAGNVAVTQLVDKPNVGVHVRLPKSIFVPR